MRAHDQQCTPMAKNWADLWNAIRHPTQGRILHEAKNVWVEGWRRITGKCPKQG